MCIFLFYVLGTIHNILENASIKEAKPGTAAHQHALNHPVKDYNETYLASSNNKFDSITYKGYSMRLKGYLLSYYILITLLSRKIQSEFTFIL